MPRKTPQELQEVKRLRAEERRQEAESRRLEDERREAQLRLEEERREAQLLELERKERERMAQERDLRERHAALASYVGGIYDEASKISTKRSTEEVSERMVDRANRAVRSARELLADENDPFLEEIEEFVPAGDPIEARDVVLTLRQVKDALDRMNARHSRAWNLRY